MDFFAFSHGFQHKKFDFHSETTRTPFGLPMRNLYECRADFSKVRLLCFIKSGKNNKLSSAKKFQRYYMNASSGFFQKI
jgi:hypothetical protein